MSADVEVQEVGRGPHDLLDLAMHTQGGIRDPYPLLRRLVAGGEWHQGPDGQAYVYGYRLCQATLRSQGLHKGGVHVSSIPWQLSQEQRDQIAAELPPDPGMLSSLDDPDHARLRRLVTISFTPKAVGQYRETVLRALDQALAGIDPHEPVDLLGSVCLSVPIQVIGELIGVPLPDRDYFARISAVAALGRDGANDFETHLRAARARTEQFAYIADMIDRERPHPGDTPLGRLIRLQQEGEKVSQEELVSLVSLMYSSGFGTTVSMLGNGLVLFMNHRDQAEILRNDPGLARQATDEVLRCDGSVTKVSYQSTGDAEVAGTRLEQGSLCTMIIGAANYDPRVWDDPAVFDIARPRAVAPLSFGLGGHYCLGVALSKLEADVVFGEMVRRFPRMELAEAPERHESFHVRRWKSVLTVLEPR